MSRTFYPFLEKKLYKRSKSGIMESMGTELIKTYMKEKKITLAELAERTSIPQSTLSKIVYGISKNPTLDNMRRIAHSLGKTLDDFADNPPEGKRNYYLDPKSAEIAQEIYDNPEMRILFDASRKATPEDLKKIAEMARIMSGGDYGDDGDDIG